MELGATLRFLKEGGRLVVEISLELLHLNYAEQCFGEISEVMHLEGSFLGEESLEPVRFSLSRSSGVSS